jgi:hypothetical protein
MAGKKKSKKPSKSEIDKLRKELNAVAREFWAGNGSKFDFILLGPPGPRPPPKKEIDILNLSSY